MPTVVLFLLLCNCQCSGAADVPAVAEVSPAEGPTVVLVYLLLLGVSAIASVPTLRCLCYCCSLSCWSKVPAAVLVYLLLLGITVIASVPMLLLKSLLQKVPAVVLAYLMLWGVFALLVLRRC
jgi:hypothetical protein